MEAGGSVLVDKGVHAKRSNPSVPAAFITSDGGSNNYCLLRTTSGAATLFPPLYASSLLPPPTYSSFPSPYSLQRQPSPSLLPLPLSRSFSLPPPGPPVSNRRIKDQRKPRSSPTKGAQSGGTRPHKQPPASAAAPVKLPKSAAATACLFKDEPEEGDFADDVYALSPPPSSLPMPKFSLKARMPPSSSSSSSSCNAETFGGVVTVGGGVNAVASDDIRQLLRL